MASPATRFLVFRKSATDICRDRYLQGLDGLEMAADAPSRRGQAISGMAGVSGAPFVAYGDLSNLIVWGLQDDDKQVDMG
jgi:hypothetical protein